MEIEASGADSNEAAAFRRNFTSQQFQRELRLQLVAKASERVTVGAVGAPGDKKKAWGKVASERHKRPPPKLKNTTTSTKDTKGQFLKTLLCSKLNFNTKKSC